MTDTKILARMRLAWEWKTECRHAHGGSLAPSAGSVLICLFGLVLCLMVGANVGHYKALARSGLGASAASVCPKGSVQPFSSIIVANRFPDKTERCGMAVSKNIFITQQPAGVNEGFPIANLLDGIFRHRHVVSGRGDVLELPSESPQLERMLYWSLIDDLRENLQEPGFGGLSRWIREDVQYAIRPHVKSLASTSILNESTYPQRAHSIKNGLRPGNCWYLNNPDYQARPLPISGVLVLFDHGVYLLLHQPALFSNSVSAGLRSLRRPARFSRLLCEGQQCEKNRPSRDSFGPTKDSEPTWQVPCGVVCAFVAILLMSRWGHRPGVELGAFLLILVAGCLILTGYVDTEPKDNCHSNSVLPRDQSFQHNGRNCTTKTLDAI